VTRSVHDLDTPAVLVDLAVAEANLARAQAYADAQGLRLRPHVKTHKLPFFAARQLARGAVGLSAQKLGEAEAMVDALGPVDLFIPYNLVGATKLARLRALAGRCALSVSADSAETVAGYAAAFADAPAPLAVLVEIDAGAGRCGVADPAAAAALARAVDAGPGLSFRGFATYPPKGGAAAAGAALVAARAEAARAGLDAAVLSSGGTPDLWRAHEAAGVTEHRPGTYIYNDRMQVGFGAAAWTDCALTVLTTVVSRPTADRAVLDAGSKALAADAVAGGGHGRIIEHPEAVIAFLNEEHGVVDLRPAPTRPRIGARVRVIPNHACVVSNLVDVVHLVDGERVLETVPVAARGRIA
jgi:D-serine deaminase-like pyridoxal phosphate-dependent protein